MGNKGSGNNVGQQVSEEELDQAVDYVIKNQSMYFTKTDLKEPISRIMRYIQHHYPLDQSSGVFKTNSSLIRMFFHPSFPRQIMKVLKLLIESLEGLNKKTHAFLKIHEIANLTDLANFIVFSSNDKITSTFDSLLVRTDIDPANKLTIKKLEEDNEGQLEVIGNLTEKMPAEEKEGVKKIIRVTLMNFIGIRNQSFSPNLETLKHLSVLEGALFMLYTKIHFSSSPSGSNTPTQKMSYKSSIIIGSYFLAAGTSDINPPIYETAVIFLLSILKLHGIEHPEIKALPSHYFKNLPVIASISIYESMLVNTLFTLKYINEGAGFFIRFAFNRIMSLKLVQLLLKDIEQPSQTITYYLEELCLQVKAGQIQRACLCEIVKEYAKMETVTSQVLKKFIEHGGLKYNLKFAEKEIKVDPSQIITELEDQKGTYAKEYRLTSEKYLSEKIFLKSLTFNINDRTIWAQILPGIISNKEDQEVFRSNKNRKLSRDEPQQEQQQKAKQNQKLEQQQMHNSAKEENNVNEAELKQNQQGGETQEQLK